MNFWNNHSWCLPLVLPTSSHDGALRSWRNGIRSHSHVQKIGISTTSYKAFTALYPHNGMAEMQDQLLPAPFCNHLLVVLALPLVTQSVLPKLRTLTLTLSLVKPCCHGSNLLEFWFVLAFFHQFTEALSRSLFYSNFKSARHYILLYFAIKVFQSPIRLEWVKSAIVYRIHFSLSQKMPE